MGYELKGDELNTLVHISSSAVGEWLSGLEEIRVQLERIIQSAAWGGASGENIRSYLQEVHVEGLLPMLSDLLYDYVAKLALYDYGYSRIDGDIHKKFNEDAIREAQQRYRTEQLEECREAFGEVLCSIGDILETVSPTIRDIENDCGRIHYRLEHLMHEISELEERTASDWTGPLGELAGALSQAVRSALSRPSGGVTGYRTGDAWNISGMQEAYLRCVSAESGWRAESVLLGEAQAYEMSVARKLWEENEAQQAEEKKKKQENTVGEMLGSGLMLLAGAAAVVCSAGTSTPLVASCFMGVSGSTVMAFGLSDAMESTVEYATGREDACNPLRDLAFLGNEEVYRSVEMAAVMTAGFGGSMSASVSVEGVITKSGFARIVAGEAAGIMTSVGIEEVGSRAGLSETERLLLNLGAGMAIGRLTERMPGRRKAGGSEGGSSRVYEENFKKNVAAAREDLDIRTRNAVEKNRIWISEGGSGTGLNSIGDYKSGIENLYTKDDIIKMLDGKTMQSTKIANGLKTGEIKLNILGDELFESCLGVDKSVVAQQVGNQIYVRRGSQSMLSDLVHEGTHVMDYTNGFGISGVSRWSWEKRAYFYERQYQIATGGKVDYSTIDDLLVHIFSNYDRGVYNPYNTWQNR